MPDARGRGEVLREAREAKFASWFAPPRRWRVCTEVSGDMQGPEGSVFHYLEGFFYLDRPWTYKSPLNHPGRRGYLVVEVGEDGADVPGTKPVPFGRGALKHAAEQYGTVSGLPPKDPVS